MTAITTGLVLDHDYTKGHVKDYGPNQLDGILVGGEGFVNSGGDNAYKPEAAGRYISVPHDPALDLDACTFAFHLDDFDAVEDEFEVFLSKGTHTGGSYMVFNGDTGFWDGFLVLSTQGGRSIFSQQSSITKASKTLIITKPAGANPAKMYVDGVLVATGSGNADITNTADNLHISSLNTGYNSRQKPSKGTMIWNVEKNATEVLAIHNYMIQRRTDRSAKRSFKNASKRGRIADGFAWNMDLNDLNNLGPVTAPLTVMGSANNAETLWGETAIEFNAISLLSGSGYLSGGDIPSLRFTTESFGGGIWVNIGDLSSFNPILMMKGSPSVCGFHLQCTGGVVAFATSQSGTIQQALAIPSIHRNVWQFVTFFSEAGGNNEVWVNGQEGGYPIARINPTSSSGFSYTIGRHSTSTVGYIDGYIARPFVSEFASRDDFLAWQEEELQTVGRNLLYREDFRDAYVHQSFITGTNRGVDGTELITDAVTSTMKVTDGDTVGEKMLLGGAFSSACQTNHIGHPYGTFHIEYLHTSGQRTRFGLYANEPKNSAAKHLVIDGSGGANARIEATLDGVLKFTSAVSSVPLGRNKVIVKLKPYGSNNCSIHDENGDLIPAVTGTNPFTVPINKDDHKYYIYAPYSNSGIYSIKQYVT